MAGLLPPLMCAHLYITIPTEEISFIILHYDAHLIDVYQLPILDVPGMALHALPAAVEHIPVLSFVVPPRAEGRFGRSPRASSLDSAALSWGKDERQLFSSSSSRRPGRREVQVVAEALRLAR